MCELLSEMEKNEEVLNIQFSLVALCFKWMRCNEQLKIYFKISIK